MIKKQFIILIFMLLLINSCKTDDLELTNGNAISTATFPVNKAELESAINGTYSPLQSQGLYGRYLTYMYDYMAGDEAYVGPTRGTPDLRDFLEYTFTAANNDIFLYWKNAYNGISRCNFILDKEDKINSLSNAEIPQVDKDNFIGQVKFLRAFYYFLLVERFGDIPLYTTTEVDPDGLAKSPKEDVYQLIISDLEDASSKLKVKSSAESGRATKGAADALLGKVYLYRQDYTNAKTAFDKVLTSGEYTLTANYFDNFESENENNAESVFEVQFAYSGGGAWAYVDWGGQDNGDSETSFRSIEYGGLGGFHNNDPSHSLVNEYEVGDSRKDDNFYFTGDTWSGGVVGAINPAAAPGYWRKYQKAYNQGSDGAGLSDINHRVIRYADVLLMSAEVENELGNMATAISLMNEVRDRIGMDNYGTPAMDVTYPVTSKEEVFTAIVHERRVELAGEESRFPDLLRWGMSNTINGFVVGKHELFPIPQKEFDTNPNLTTADLRERTKKRIPKFAFEYLDGGCNNDVNLGKNMTDIQEIELRPEYLSVHTKSSMKINLFGVDYDAPFGIAPVGLQGLMWPNSAEILAKAAFDTNIPFILSTVSTSSIETIAEITEGKAWFQLYHPAEEKITDDILKRATVSGYDVLVILADVPTFGYRPRDIRNGLAMPPRMTLNNILQILRKPNWALQTLKHGQPTFKTLEPYMPKGLDLKQLGAFMDQTFSGRLNEYKVKILRDKWKGKIIIKGIANVVDVEKSIALGMDGIIISNHGGRQLDAGESTIHSLHKIVTKYRGQTKIMIDGGIRSGPDIARMLASGAEFTFMGRPFMYGVSALGKNGGDHTINILKTQLQQVMEQLCCERIEDFPKHIINRS